MFCKNKTPNQGVRFLDLVTSTKEDLILLLFIGLKNKLIFIERDVLQEDFQFNIIIIKFKILSCNYWRSFFITYGVCI